MTPLRALARRCGALPGRAQTACGNPGRHGTSGLVAYFGDDPVGRVAVEPRTAYRTLPHPAGLLLPAPTR